MFCVMTVCGWLPPCHEGAAGCRFDRHLFSVCLCTSSLWDTSSHVFIVKPLSRSRLLKKKIIISHGGVTRIMEQQVAALIQQVMEMNERLRQSEEV